MKSDCMLRLAIFADIHGKFLLPFKLVHHYQTLTGEKIDGILQCGDMGAFPDKNRMDKATPRPTWPWRVGVLWRFCYAKTRNLWLS